MKLTVTFVLFSLALACQAQPIRTTVRDLQPEWKEQLPTAGEQTGNTIYFALDAVADRGTYLHVHSIRPHEVWCQGRLMGTYTRDSYLSIDSLARLYSASLSFGVHVKDGPGTYSTSLVRNVPSPPDPPLQLRQKTFFLSFSILVVLMLAIAFLILMNANSRLLLDYFNLVKLFTLQERDETLAAGRLGTSINLMVYLFVGMWLSFLVLVIFHFTPEEWILAKRFWFHSVAEGMVKWLHLSAWIVGALFLKVFLGSIGTSLFKFREGYTIQVLNFFRQAVLVAISLSLVIAIYFMAGVDQSSYFHALSIVVGWLLIVWYVLIFFKLLGKAPFSGFHLFSYLCATEIFPLVIFFEILFF